MRLLPGYEAHIVDPGDDGFGRLAVKGPGLFGGYLNARAAYTVDGFFLTGDTAALYGGKLFVKERTEDMFVSGGENVYPAEIKEKLLRVAGVSDAHVFGAPGEDGLLRSSSARKRPRRVRGRAATRSGRKRRRRRISSHP